MSLRAPDETRMSLLGNIIIWVGCIIYLVGEAKFMVVAYRRSLPWFFGYLFIPLVGLLFFLLNIRKTWQSVVLQIVGLVIVVAGCCLGRTDLLQ